MWIGSEGAESFAERGRVFCIRGEELFQQFPWDKQTLNQGCSWCKPLASSVLLNTYIYIYIYTYTYTHTYQIIRPTKGYRIGTSLIWRHYRSTITRIPSMIVCSPHTDALSKLLGERSVPYHRRTNRSSCILREMIVTRVIQKASLQIATSKPSRVEPSMLLHLRPK